MEIEKVARLIHEFEGKSLTDTVAGFERDFRGLNRAACTDLCEERSLNAGLFEAAGDLKRLASQIHVIIHALGILIALPSILDDGEEVESLSLGAGNTGRKFDLETNRRIAEFKFIHWRGGAESIRQNSLFKDFFGLAEADTGKDRYLYVLGKEKPLNFLCGHRSLDSVMSRNQALRKEFTALHGDRFRTVSEYYEYRKMKVEIVDISSILSAS